MGDGRFTLCVTNQRNELCDSLGRDEAQAMARVSEPEASVSHYFDLAFALIKAWTI